MPRAKQALFSKDELKKIAANGGKLAKWARTELKRREKAGKLGGRPKAKE